MQLPNQFILYQLSAESLIACYLQPEANVAYLPVEIVAEEMNKDLSAVLTKTEKYKSHFQLAGQPLRSLKNYSKRCSDIGQWYSKHVVEVGAQRKINLLSAKDLLVFLTNEANIPQAEIPDTLLDGEWTSHYVEGPPYTARHRKDEVSGNESDSSGETVTQASVAVAPPTKRTYTRKPRDHTIRTADTPLKQKLAQVDEIKDDDHDDDDVVEVVRETSAAPAKEPAKPAKSAKRPAATDEADHPPPARKLKAAGPDIRNPPAEKTSEPELAAALEKGLSSLSGLQNTRRLIQERLNELQAMDDALQQAEQLMEKQATTAKAIKKSVISTVPAATETPSPKKTTTSKKDNAAPAAAVEPAHKATEKPAASAHKAADKATTAKAVDKTTTAKAADKTTTAKTADKTATEKTADTTSSKTSSNGLSAAATKSSKHARTTAGKEKEQPAAGAAKSLPSLQELENMDTDEVMQVLTEVTGAVKKGRPSQRDYQLKELRDRAEAELKGSGKTLSASTRAAIEKTIVAPSKGHGSAASPARKRRAEEIEGDSPVATTTTSTTHAAPAASTTTAKKSSKPSFSATAQASESDKNSPVPSASGKGMESPLVPEDKPAKKQRKHASNTPASASTTTSSSSSHTSNGLASAGSATPTSAASSTSTGEPSKKHRKTAKKD
ncbi:hypothetical protein RI367_006754 [Sorochytrium milnesiophthora]